MLSCEQTRNTGVEHWRWTLQARDGNGREIGEEEGKEEENV
jgi:hypothetical protein